MRCYLDTIQFSSVDVSEPFVTLFLQLVRIALNADEL